MKNKCCIAINFALISIIVIVLVLQFIMMGNNPDNQENILTTVYQNPNTTQIGDTIISFDENEIQVGNAISHVEGSNVININENGIYQVSYQLFGTRDTIGIFNFSTVLLVNGNPIENTLNEGPILFDQVVNRMTITGTVFLELNAGDQLQLGGVSVEAIRYTRARIDIEKIE